MKRKLALLILLFFIGQAGISDPSFIYTQKIELISETECNEESEIQLLSSRKKKGKAILKQQFLAIFPSQIHKLPTYPISQAVAITQARHIIFRSLLI